METLEPTSIEIALMRTIDGILSSLGLLEIYKARDDEEVAISIEIDLAELLKSSWDKHTLNALNKLMQFLSQGQGDVTREEIAAALDILAKELGPDLIADQEDQVYEYVAQAFLFGRNRTAQKLRVNPVLNLEDTHAQQALQEHTMYWINTYYDRELRDQIANIVRFYAFEQGLGRAEVARELQRALITKPFAQGYQYWDVLASSVIQRSRAIGVVRTFEQAEVTEYRWLAMMDERTCPICSRLDGKLIKTEYATRTIRRLLWAENPETVKTITPWLSGDEETLKWLESADGSDLFDKGVVLPPAHGRCRCTLVAEVRLEEEREVPVAPEVSTISVKDEMLPEVSLSENKQAAKFLLRELGVNAIRQGKIPDAYRSRLKDEICQKLTKSLVHDKDFMEFAMQYVKRRWPDVVWNPDEQTVYRVVDQLIHLWAYTSADDEANAIALQLVAKEIFGLTDTVMPWRKRAREETLKKAEELVGRYKKAYAAFLKAQYDLTQKALAKAKIKYVTLYRGMSWDPKERPEWLSALKSIVEIEEVSMQPMNSFTIDFSTAINFATLKNEGVVIALRVPASRILATARTGYGCLKEGEFIVIGGRAKVIATNVQTIIANTRTGSEEKWFYANLQKIIPEAVMKIMIQKKGDVVINLDDTVYNSDWPKRTWDLPDPGSKEFKELMHGLGITEEKLKQMPVYQHWLNQKREKKK